MRHANSSTTWRRFLLLGTLILALGLVGHGRWLASAQPMDVENGPLHPLSQQGLIPPVYLLNEGQLEKAVKSLNVNSGLWNPYQVTPAGSSPEVLAAADYSGNGRNDVVMATDPGVDPQNDSKLHRFQWRSTAEMVHLDAAISAQYPRGIATGDLDGDKMADVALVDNNTNTLVLFYQAEPGVFTPMQIRPVGADPNAVAIGDLNADGRPDVAVAHATAATLLVCLQQADGSLATPITYPASGGAINDLIPGDLDGDGDTDLVLVRGTGHFNAEIALYYQDGGALQTPVTRDAHDFGYGAHAGAIGDITGDGRADLVVGAGGNVPESSLNVFVQQADGTLPAAPVVIDAYHFPSAIDIADVNHDGRNDVAALHDGFPAITLFLQQPDGTLGDFESYSFPSTALYQPKALALADVTGDGAIDAVIANSASGLIVFSNRNPVSATIVRSVFDGGGDLGTSTNFRLNSVLGQPMLGNSVELTGTGITLQPGFLSAWASPPIPNPPDTTIDSAPPDPSTSDMATFTFSSGQPGSTFLCQLDGLDFVPCASPHAYSDLTNGVHRFRAKATNGNGETDPTAATHIWTVSATPPDTTIDAYPDDPTTSTSATFEFSSDQPGGTFLCDLDGGGFASCTSPATYVGLALGQHTFSAQAVNPGGLADPTPAVYTWTIVPPCYTLSLAVDPPTGGSIQQDPAPDCNDGVQYTQGTIVSLTASPATGLVFDYWSGDATGSTNPTTVTMSADRSVNAYFAIEIAISNVQVTNVKDRSFTVSWITDQPSNGQVRYGTDPASLIQIADDDRGAGTVDDTHHVTVAGLNPSALYYFDVMSGATVDDNGGAHYNQFTGPELGPPNVDTVYGRVYKQDGTTFADGAVVYLLLQDNNGQGSPGSAGALSVLVQESDGYWFLNLAEARTSDLAGYFGYSSSGDVVDIFVEGAGDCTATLTVDTAADSPVQDIILSCYQDATLTFNPGWNLIALPLDPETPYTAQSLLDDINSQGGTCNEIDQWINGGWAAHINGLPFNNFPIELGHGYFVRCDNAGSWTYQGQPLTSGVPLPLNPGWNLIGVPFPPSGYLAQSLLDGIASQGGACVEIDRWTNGGWSAHINGLPFNNFAIEPDQGYFVKCSVASTFVPQVVAQASSEGWPEIGRMPALDAASNPHIEDVLVTNRRDVAFSVVWRTDLPSDGWIEYGATPELGQLAYDDRGEAVVSTAHHVTVIGLQPQMTTYLKLHSGNTTDDDQGRMFQVTTTATGVVATPVTAFGQVQNAEGTPATGTLVVARTVNSSAESSEPLSTLVDRWGYWAMNLNLTDCKDVSLVLQLVGPGGVVNDVTVPACNAERVQLLLGEK